MRQHRWMNDYRDPDERRRCPVCGNILSNDEKFYIIETETGKKIIGCHECIKTSTPDTPCECPVCDEKFNEVDKYDTYVYHDQQGKTVGCMWCVFEEYPEDIESRTYDNQEDEYRMVGGLYV